MQLEVILYLLGRLFNIPTNWYWYFNICFCSNAQFLTPRETLDSYRKKKQFAKISINYASFEYAHLCGFYEVHEPVTSKPTFLHF